ncbi:MAG: lipid-A-disaccharide synthase [Deltaproteobacteria bacterium]|nr:lipid-A-disaccharide synthase [Deltaproteobacteria bacterium]
MIVAGEASGDHHAARLVRALKDTVPDVFCFGIGGGRMEAEGVRLFARTKDVSVVGLTEIAARFGGILSALWTAGEMLKSMAPDLLILVDFPDFNFRVAGYASRLNVPVLYYISPQVWAWRRSRVKKIRRMVDKMAVILPFEEAFYKEHGIDAEYVGHPLADWAARLPEKQPPGEHPLVGLLPGSRPGEVSRHLPILLDAARIIGGRIPGVEFLLARAPDIEEEYVRGFIQEAEKKGKLPGVRLVQDAAEVFSRADMALTVSGTVTLEAALAGLPMIILYRLSAISFAVAKALIRVDFIGLPNLIARRAVVPELIQGRATPRAVADIACDWLQNPEKLAEVRRGLDEVRSLVGGPGASARAAKLALELLKR